MLWSLLKILFFGAIVSAGAWAAVWLLDYDGAGILITFNGEEYTLTPLLAVMAVMALLVALWVTLKIVSLLVATLRFVNGDETAISRYFDRNRERKGFAALGEGLMALAAGEGRVAMAKADKAERYLQKPELTDLVKAQAAELSGDRRKAEEIYKRLVLKKETRFVGVRGIMRQKLADGDTDTALKLAERAFALRPRHGEVQDVLLKLQAQKKDWSGVRTTLKAKLKSGALPRDVHKRRDAVLALSQAKDILADGKTIEAREAAIEANKMSPDLIPAAVMAAHSYIEQDKPKYAVRLLRKAWEVQPHPDLAAAFAAIAPNETPAARLKRFQTLTAVRKDHRETKLLLAELHITAEDFPQARRDLGDLVSSDADARVLTIMAAIERGEGAPDAVVKGWLARALTAPRGPQWVCENCNNIQHQWAPVCGNCASFDTLSWKSPRGSDMPMLGGAEMLPLIVGTPDEPTPTPEDVSEDADNVINLSAQDTTPPDAMDEPLK